MLAARLRRHSPPADPGGTLDVLLSKVPAIDEGCCFDPNVPKQEMA